MRTTTRTTTGASAPTSGSSATLIPNTCFNSYSSFEQYFGYLYPWGSDHNGSARMLGNSSFHEYISVDSGTLTLMAQPAPSGQPPSTANPYPAIHYFSGTVHGIQQFTVNRGQKLTFTSDIQATTTKGTWPAFWLTAVVGWPPEIDMAEWKGSGKVSFNAFNVCPRLFGHIS
jgi:galactan endo-beta-1,3-galactanase